MNQFFRKTLIISFSTYRNVKIGFFIFLVKIFIGKNVSNIKFKMTILFKVNSNIYIYE